MPPEYLMYLALSACLISVVLLVLICVLFYKQKKLKKQIDTLTYGLEGVNIEKTLARIEKDINDIETANILKDDKISRLQTDLNFTIKKIGFVKYNAFINKEAGRGGELSFSVAFLDGFDNGFVLSSIYTSQTSVCYAKPIKNKKSEIPLSDEEMYAIEKAITGV